MTRVALLGAAGMMGTVIARDLADRGVEVRALDVRGGDRVTAVDATDPAALEAALDGCVLLVNAASYRVNLGAMDAALAAGCDYVDLGGLYHVTAQQLARDATWAAAGRLAVLGCGAGPGKTNVLALWALEALGGDPVALRCASAGLDEAGPSLPYALQTLRDELAERPIVRRDGADVALDPRTVGGEVDFGDPIGVRPTLFTLHSEPLTLPAPTVDFRLGLMPEVQRALVDGASLPAPSPRTWSVQRVDAETTAGRAVARALTPPHDAWGVGGQLVSTASVAAAVADLLVAGALAGHAGVLPPEDVLTPDGLWPELERRGTTFTLDLEPAA